MSDTDIEFIYFDVGGVVVLDFSKTDRWEELLDDLNINQRESFTALFDVYEPELCTGTHISEFIKAAENNLKVKFPPNYSMIDDFVSRFEPNPTLGELIFQLKSKYKIGLLTNMYPQMLETIINQKLLPEVKWDAIIDSSNVKCKKPDSQIYQIAEEKSQTVPENILFVENTQKHIDAAKNRNWQTFLYDPANIDKSNKELQDLL